MANVIESRVDGPIGGIDLNLARRHLFDAQRAIASINYSDVWKHIGVVIKCGDVRIESGKARKGRGVSLQMLVKGQNNPAGCGTAVANITVDEKLKRYLGGADKQMKQRIAQIVRSAFLRSVSTGWNVKVEDGGEEK